MIQTGPDFRFYATQVAAYRARPLCLHKDFDLIQVKDINTDAFYISNYVPDVDNLVERLKIHVPSKGHSTRHRLV